MPHSPLRRAMLLAAASTPFMGLNTARAQQPDVAASLLALEQTSGGRLGVQVIRDDGTTFGHRPDERFAFCSTFKVMLVSAVLHRDSRSGPGTLLDQRIRYTEHDLVPYSPISKQHTADGMTVAQLCAAGIQFSDNTSANLLLKLLGGPPAVTRFARSIGDTTFRLDRQETELNDALPGDPRDTTTPAAMSGSLRKLALGDALAPEGRARLIDWMRGCTTGTERIRAGVPQDWQVADKTGTGDYGTSNDIAIAWPPGKPPVVMTIYFTQHDPHAKARSDVIASAARIIAGALA
jgi:beta-lactamase class A